MDLMADLWLKEYNEAAKSADDIAGLISTYFDSLSSGPESFRPAPTVQRKLTILGTRLDGLQSALAKLPGNKCLLEFCGSEKEMNRRKDMLSHLRAQVNQISAALRSSKENRDSLLGPDTKFGLGNQGLVGLQRQIMKGKLLTSLSICCIFVVKSHHLNDLTKALFFNTFGAEQDNCLEKLEQTVVSTKHIALAVNEELELQVRLIDSLDQHVDSTDERMQRVRTNLAVLHKHTKSSCSCTCMLLAVPTIVILAAIVYLLIKFL
ncbi:hypothetical protein MLD38_002229 [Melastoma candidum]|uniref:Uncharacterized protein n=1 Tax=Melastoma candidum TaxID=119954 RepID=A0ACB9SJR9_9MYRT|nr:hypothetical protein MLD38_002229 [Melastoma candidum]